MSDISIDNLTKHFGDVVAVEGFDLEISDGEFVVLVGPSGCGKTTTLRMISGLETPTEGSIRFGDQRVDHLTPQDRNVAMVFQDYALYPHMSVQQNMRFGLEEEEGYTSEERTERVEKVAEMLDIEELLDRSPDELSGGQQQRVALGRAIVRDPAVFLMDEPLSNLDAKLRAQMRTELQQLQSQLGVTTIYVTHDQTEAMTMSDRMVVMDDGRIQQVGSPLELYHEPANLFVAEFLGEPSMNFLRGAREDSSFVTEHMEYPLDSEIVDAIGTVDDVVFGIRPEEIQVDDATSESPEDHEFTMDVTVVEPMGDRNVLHLRFPSSSGTEDLIAATDGKQYIQEGSRVTARLPLDTVHFFDRESDQALYNRRLAYEEEEALQM